MNITDKSKITNFLNFNFKLIVLSSLLFSQLSLSEIFLYQNSPKINLTNIAKADSPNSWYSTGGTWSYRKAITIDFHKVAADLTYFPVLINIVNDSDIGAYALSNGYDIRFTDSTGAGVPLDYERENFVITGGQASANIWVKVPAVSSSLNTVVYMYYGNAGASDGENRTGVWDDGGASHFKLVQHLNENPSGTAPQMLDSTTNHNDGTSGGMGSGNQVTGQIYKATNFVEGNKSYIQYPMSSLYGKSTATLSAWFKTTDSAGGILDNYNNSGYYSYMLNVNDGKLKACFGTGYTCNQDNEFNVSYGTNINDGSWHHAVVTYDGSSIVLYVDGVQRNTSAKTGNIAPGWDIGTTGFEGFISNGTQEQGDEFLSGTIDEVRISDIARTSQWVSTEYANQSSSSSFILPLGTEENLATSYTLTAPSPSSGLVNTASQDFIITPNGVYNGTITITLSGGGLSAAITRTFASSSTPQTFTITPTEGGTVTLTPSSGSTLTDPSPVTYTSISTSASPSSVTQASTNNTINITGIGTSWTPGTPGTPAFTLSGGTGAFITSQTIIDPTHATLSVNAGSTAGTLSITYASGPIATVSVVPSTADQITSFSLTNPAATGTVDNNVHTVNLTVPYGTDVTTLTPIIAVSANATINPLSGIAQNFTSPATYTVTAQDGTTTQDYTVTVNIFPSTGGGFISPVQPIIPIQNDRIDTSNLPPDIIQIAISRTPDFKDVSWEVFSNEEIKQLDNCPDKLYIKFRNKSGAVSDVIIYIPKISNDTNISSLKDGDIVKTINDPDVYIIKLKNNKKYKRLILSPSVFNSYQHLKRSNLKIISQTELDQYATSSLVKETTDTIIYTLYSNGDKGERKILDTTIPYDVDSVYEINKTDRDSYTLVK